MKAAVGTAGMLKVLEDKAYGKRNSIDNETIFYILQVATADGHAAHLVDKHEDKKDGYEAYRKLVRWFEGDKLTTETAEDIRSKMDRLNLSTKNTASEYINQFLQHNKHLEELNEGYTRSKTVNIFLSQIMDPYYGTTVEHCLENRLDIHTCIEKIRAKERRITRLRATKRKIPIIIRRQPTEEEKNDHQVIKLESYINERGFYSVPGNIWFLLSDEDKSHVKEHNGKMRRERSDSDKSDERPYKKRKHNIRNRRNISDEEKEDDSHDSDDRRTVQFKGNMDNDDKDHVEDEDGTSDKRLRPRRGVLRFHTKK